MANKHTASTKQKKTAVHVSSTRQISLPYTEPQTAVNALQLPAIPGMALRVMRQLEAYIRQAQ